MPYLDKPRTRDQRLGEAFKLDASYEHLLTMTAERRDDLLKGSPVLRISLGHYRAARDAALELEKERTS